MSFQAKVKETDQLFVATNELDKDRVWSKDAQKLEKANPMSAISFQQFGPAIPLRMVRWVNLDSPFLKAMCLESYLSA